MLEFTGPWMDFPIPSEVVRDEDLEAAQTDLTKYAKLVLIKRLRENADYTVFLPSLTSCKAIDEVKGRIGIISKTTDPNFYLTQGTAVLDSLILGGIQTFEIDKLPTNGLPTILFKVSSLIENNQIFDTVMNRRDKLPLVYWVAKTKLMDTQEKSLSDLGFALYEEEGKELREALFSYGVNVSDLSDFTAIEKYRQNLMYVSEADYYQVVLYDKIGFFGALGGISNPIYRQKLSHSAFITDNRADFYPNDIQDYILNIADKDYINYRFKVVDINGIAYLQVQWRFPQASYAKKLLARRSFSPSELVTLYTKKEL